MAAGWGCPGAQRLRLARSVRLSWGRSVGLRRGAACGCTEAQRGTALECNLGLRWGAACGCAGAQCGAALRRSVELRMGAAWGGAGVQHAAAHGRKIGLRRGQREAALGRSGCARRAVCS